MMLCSYSPLISGGGRESGLGWVRWGLEKHMCESKKLLSIPFQHRLARRRNRRKQKHASLHNLEEKQKPSAFILSYIGGVGFVTSGDL